MLHELVEAFGPNAAEGTIPDGGSSIALIGLIGVIVTTLGAIVVARIQRGRAAATATVKLITVPESHLDDLISERNKAQSDAKVAESECDQVTAENRLLRKAIGQLREAMIHDATTNPDSVYTADVRAIL